MTSVKPKIAIVGAGPAGLTLARLLYLKDIPCTIFEREASRHDRSQGGTLDLHTSTGQRALFEAGLRKGLEAIMRPEGEDMVILDKHGGKHWEDSGNDHEAPPDGGKEDHGGPPADRGEGRESRPEVDRIALRELLLDSLPEGLIKWDHKLIAISVDTASRYSLEFKDHPGEGPFDLLVGADGAWSRTRTMVSTVKPIYSGISGVEVRHNDVDATYPHLSAYVGRGSSSAMSDNKALMAQRNGHGIIRTYAMMRTPENWVKECGIDFTNENETKEKMLAYFSDWTNTQKDLIRLAEPEIAPRALYMLPLGFKWDHRKGVTLIGDAAHLMTPFAGEGVNLGMADALELSYMITVGIEGLDERVKKYEEDMYVRAAEKAEESWNNLNLFFMDDAPKEFVEAFKKMIQGPPPQ